MPDLQAEMDEPLYAFLVQGKACQARLEPSTSSRSRALIALDRQVCGTTRLRTEAEHTLRVRACSKCMTAKYVSSRLRARFLLIDSHSQPPQRLPHPQGDARPSPACAPVLPLDAVSVVARLDLRNGPFR